MKAMHPPLSKMLNGDIGDLMKKSLFTEGEDLKVREIQREFERRFLPSDDVICRFVLDYLITHQLSEYVVRNALHLVSFMNTGLNERNLQQLSLDGAGKNPLVPKEEGFLMALLMVRHYLGIGKLERVSKWVKQMEEWGYFKLCPPVIQTYLKPYQIQVAPVELYTALEDVSLTSYETKEFQVLYSDKEKGMNKTGWMDVKQSQIVFHRYRQQKKTEAILVYMREKIK